MVAGAGTAAGAGTETVGTTAAGAVAFAGAVTLAGTAMTGKLLFVVAVGCIRAGAAALPTAAVALAGRGAITGALMGAVATIAGSTAADVIAGAVAFAAGSKAAGCGAIIALGANPKLAGATSALGASTGALTLAGTAPGSLVSIAAGACKENLQSSASHTCVP